MGLLQPLPLLPDHCWEQVSHDLVTGLPKTPRGYDTIITFVDRLSKRILLQQALLTQLVMQDFFLTTFSGIWTAQGINVR
jgi:hypothetical protein